MVATLKTSSHVSAHIVCDDPALMLVQIESRQCGAWGSGMFQYVAPRIVGFRVYSCHQIHHIGPMVSLGIRKGDTHHQGATCSMPLVGRSSDRKEEGYGHLVVNNPCKHHGLCRSDTH